MDDKKQRIRYYKHPSKKLIYSEDILANNKVVVVTILKDSNTYVVVEKTSRAAIKVQACSSLTLAKRRAKIYLRSIGANFYDEIRTRKFQAGC